MVYTLCMFAKIRPNIGMILLTIGTSLLIYALVIMYGMHGNESIVSAVKSFPMVFVGIIGMLLSFMGIIVLARRGV